MTFTEWLVLVGAMVAVFALGYRRGKQRAYDEFIDAVMVEAAKLRRKIEEDMRMRARMKGGGN